MARFFYWTLKHWLTRGKKSQIEKRKRNLKKILQFPEEKEKSEFPFPSFEKRKRNQTKCSQLSRREREIFNTFFPMREEKENIDILLIFFESRKRKVK